MRAWALPITLAFIFLCVQITASQDASPPPEQILFHDDFEDGELSDWNNYTERAEVVTESDGNHALHLTGTDWTGVEFGESAWDNYAVEARIKIHQSTDGETPDLLFHLRNTSEGENYNAYVSLKWSGVGMGANLDGAWSRLEAIYQTYQPAVQADVWHIFRFQSFDNVLRLYFDNELIVEYTDEARRLSAGNITFVTAPNADVYIDDVYVLNTDVLAGLQAPELAFSFDETLSSCDYDALPSPSTEILTGVTLRELNLRSEPDTNASVISFFGQGTTFTFADIAAIGTQTSMRLQLPLNYLSNQITSSLWYGVKDDHDRLGYIWGRASQANPPQTPFINPYNTCIAEGDTTGWTEVLQAEFGDTWLSFQTGIIQNTPSSLIVALALDGIWIEEPIPLYGAQGELLAIAHLSMRGYYLDIAGELQSIIMPIYVQTDVNQASDFLGFSFIPTMRGFANPENTKLSYERNYPDLRGRLVCPTLSQDYEELLRYVENLGGLSEGQDGLVQKIERYELAHSEELARFMFAGDAGLGVLWSLGNGINPCSVGRDSAVSVTLPSQ